MDGIGLDNMLSAEQVEKMFSGTPAASVETGADDAEGGETPDAHDGNNDKQETVEVDLSSLLGNQPESVGSEDTTEGNGGAPESSDGSGTPQANLFSSIARILRDKGVFPDLSDDALNEISDEAALEKLFDDKVTSMFDERQRNLEKAVQGGATSEELKAYQTDLGISQFLESRDTQDTLVKEGKEGEDLRKKVMYQDYINRGFKHERALKFIEDSFAAGKDIEDAKEAFDSCREFYKERVDRFQQEMEERKKEQKANEDKQYANLKKHILDTDSFYDGVKVDKGVRQKAYDLITKPSHRDEQGNYLTELQRYQREHPIEFMENVALMYALTDGFKSTEKLVKPKVKAGMKKGFAELESVINSTRRNGDGTLNLANGGPDLSERDNWTLA